MELLFYSGIVSITDWKYTTSVGIKNQVFWAGRCSYTFLKKLNNCNCCRKIVKLTHSL